MLNSTPENTLWQQMKAGNTAALHTIYDTYFLSLYNYGKHFGADDSLVEDCIQDLFIRLWESRQKLSDIRSIRYYLICSLRRALVLHKKQNLRWYHTTDFELILKMDCVSEEETTENHQNLLKALEMLNAKQREAIYLKFYNGLSYKEIAEITDQKVDTVYKTVARALGVIREKLVELPVLLVLGFYFFFQYSDGL